MPLELDSEETMHVQGVPVHVHYWRGTRAAWAAECPVPNMIAVGSSKVQARERLIAKLTEELAAQNWKPGA